MLHTETTSIDAMFDALSDVRRRRVLFALLAHNPRVVSPPDPFGEEQYSVEHHHIHLPKLAEAGFVTFDTDEKRVERGPRFEEIRLVLELLNDHGDELPDELV